MKAAPRPFPVKIVIDPVADRLHHKTHGFSLDSNKPFEPQDVVFLDNGGKAFRHCIAIRNCRPIDHETLELVMVVIVFRIIAMLRMERLVMAFMM